MLLLFNCKPRRESKPSRSHAKRPSAMPFCVACRGEINVNQPRLHSTTDTKHGDYEKLYYYTQPHLHNQKYALHNAFKYFFQLECRAVAQKNGIIIQIICHQISGIQNVVLCYKLMLVVWHVGGSFRVTRGLLDYSFKF